MIWEERSSNVCGYSSYSNSLFVLFDKLPSMNLDRQSVVLHFIYRNIRVLNVQRTNPMRIAFTVLANTELRSTIVTKSKSPVNLNITNTYKKRCDP